jgi:beta-mannosidase
MPQPRDAITDWEFSADRSNWVEARVPGTVAGALSDAAVDLDAQDWWYRARLHGAPAAQGEKVLLRFDGLATLADIYLDDELILESRSMFERHTVDISHRQIDGSQLSICFRALTPVLAEPKKPRARWRPRIAPSGLRHVRTMMMGRAPGFAAGPPVVGPWRPVTIERRTPSSLIDFRMRAALTGDNGVLSFSAGHAPSDATVVVTGPTGTVEADLQSGQLTLPSVAKWWPHTHGQPSLYNISVRADDNEVDVGRVGFRSLTFANNIESDGLDLHVNGVPVFARGAVWTPLNIVTMNPDRQRLRTTLTRVRDAGMNMLRVPGTSAYESREFHDLCDEFGIMVWQDFMFANFDYPITDDDFRARVQAEATDVIERLAWRPSTAVFCGNSEVEQQAAMLGRAVEEGRGPLFGELLPELVQHGRTDALYVPSAPCGGELPFRPGSGIANYYGVGGYRRPLADARAAGVKFAAECLAFANHPNDDDMADVNVPADVGTDWTFADVRRYYARQLYGEGADEDVEINRSVTGEVMAEVFGEWRRQGSPCGGGLVLWLTDLADGSGWGVLDHHGRPKAAYHHLRRALAPTTVWMTDEGLGGLDVHVANDGGDPLNAQLRISFYRGEARVDEGTFDIHVDAHAVHRWGVEALLGRFVDASYAYRFGPPAFDLVVASLEAKGGLVSQAFRFPAGRPRLAETADQLGLMATFAAEGDSIVMKVQCRRLVHGLRPVVAGFEADDDSFTMAPGTERVVRLRPSGGSFVVPTTASLKAVNLSPAIVVPITGSVQ